MVTVPVHVLQSMLALALEYSRVNTPAGDAANTRSEGSHPKHSTLSTSSVGAGTAAYLC